MYIEVNGARENVLKNINVKIPKNKLVLITGVSGSGKSSLAFNTISAEGARLYMENLSTFVRQYVNAGDKPDVDSIIGLSPSLSISQKSILKNPRSNVSTMTEIYDHLRLLYSVIGEAHSPATNKKLIKYTIPQMVDQILRGFKTDTKLHLLAPIKSEDPLKWNLNLYNLKNKGYSRISDNGEIKDLESFIDHYQPEIRVVIDRVTVDEKMRQRMSASIQSALTISNGILIVEVACDDAIYEGQEVKNRDTFFFANKIICEESGLTIDNVNLRLFSFNAPYGACKTCNGLGVENYIDPSMVISDQSLSLESGAILPWTSSDGRKNYKKQHKILSLIARYVGIDVTAKWSELSDEHKDIILYGFKDHDMELPSEIADFPGVIPILETQLQKKDKTYTELAKYQISRKCNTCKAYRLNSAALSIKINGMHIGEVNALSVEDAIKTFIELPQKLTPMHNTISKRIISEILKKLYCLEKIGLGYLNLDRVSSTLSGGESQRVRLASQVSSGLSGIIYVLDEPSIGLHKCDNIKLIDSLRKLRDLGNTVIVVEHDEETIMAADYVIDIGPGAGIHGGNVVACGTPEEISKNENSITGRYISKNLNISRTKLPIGNENRITIKNASLNNLRCKNVSIPLNRLVCFTGVSGSGKSSLVTGLLYNLIKKNLDNKTNDIIIQGSSVTGIEHIGSVVEINQMPIGRTPRSNPATYIGIFNCIRDWFASLHLSRVRGYKASNFSFNVDGGRCAACKGDGLIKIEMHFLSDVYVTCEVCNGKRYNDDILEVKYKGYSIADVLDMRVSEALNFFSNIPMIYEKISILNDIGLGYIKICQSATTLSGGEAQRIKLAKELSRKSVGSTIYILDEPTTGLHPHDINCLLSIINKLVERGNTVIIIEHNMDLIRNSDYVIDLGPGGGKNGGNVVFCGTPSELTQSKVSITGRYLKMLTSNENNDSKKLFLV